MSVNRTEFDQSLREDTAPPAEASLPVTALWWLCNKNWQKAHDLIDAEPGVDVAWVHALLHRMEGDQMNANYWYNRAGRPRPDQTIGRELDAMLGHFLN